LAEVAGFDQALQPVTGQTSGSTRFFINQGGCDRINHDGSAYAGCLGWGAPSASLSGYLKGLSGESENFPLALASRRFPDRRHIGIPSDRATGDQFKVAVLAQGNGNEVEVINRSILAVLRLGERPTALIRLAVSFDFNSRV
jgi:hypothetical protein